MLCCWLRSKKGPDPQQTSPKMNEIMKLWRRPGLTPRNDEEGVASSWAHQQPSMQRWAWECHESPQCPAGFVLGKGFVSPRHGLCSHLPGMLCHGRTAFHLLQSPLGLPPEERVSKEPITCMWELMETAWDWKPCHWGLSRDMYGWYGGMVAAPSPSCTCGENQQRQTSWSHKAPIAIIFFLLTSKSAKGEYVQNVVLLTKFLIDLGVSVHVNEEKEEKGEPTSQRVTSKWIEREERRKPVSEKT